MTKIDFSKMDADEYYLQRVESGYLGNAPIWWALNGQGYTAYVQNAERFPEEKARAIADKSYGKYKAWKCDLIDRRLNVVFDHQQFDCIDEEPDPERHMGAGRRFAPHPNAHDAMKDEILRLRAKLADVDVLLIDMLEHWMTIDPIHNPEMAKVKARVIRAIRNGERVPGPESDAALKRARGEA